MGYNVFVPEFYMKYKAIFLDVDGTIMPIKEKSKPSSGVITAINAASKKLQVGVMTSRSYKDFRPLLDLLSLNAPCALDSGAEIIDPLTKTVLWEKSLSRDELRLVYHIVLSFGLKMRVHENEHAKRYAPGRKFYKPLSMYTPAIPVKKAQELAALLMRHKKFAFHRVIAWEKNTEHIYVCHPEASKEQALIDIAHTLGIELNEIIGVGDGPNDIAFLRLCGLKVAMGNAQQEVKGIADYIAPSVDEGGVVDVIKKFILSV